jgi:tRNA-2-methylthio-N6-dimethylallyladenosine synthase
MEGCDMFCSFCVVPTTRGREISRPAAGILEEARQLVGRGACEITLLGQTVNAYGRHDLKRDRAAQAGTMAFADLLARLDEIPGLERIRYTSPHPLFFDAALISAHAELDSVCPHVHLPMQSGSNRILEAMRRRYDRDRFLEICAALRSAVPDIAITSDIIVAFPGETEADFEDTLSLVREARLVDSYSFKYSARPDTAAAELPGRVDAAEAQRRLVALQAVQRELTIAYHRSRVGQSTRVLVEGESRRGGGQLCGRDPHHRVVNLSGFSGVESPAPGELIAVDVVEVTPHSLIAAPAGTADAKAAVSPGNAGRIDTLTVKLPGRSADEAIAGRARSEAGADPLRVD